MSDCVVACLQAAAQITKRSRVGKLAFQRGECRLLCELCANAQEERIALEILCDFLARRSKVQISVSFIEKSEKHQPQFRYKGVAVFDFLWYNNFEKVVVV